MKFGRKLSRSRLSALEQSGKVGKETIVTELLKELVAHYGSNMRWVIYGPSGGYYNSGTDEDPATLCMNEADSRRLDRVLSLTPEQKAIIDALLNHFDSTLKR